MYTDIYIYFHKFLSARFSNKNILINIEWINSILFHILSDSCIQKIFFLFDESNSCRGVDRILYNIYFDDAVDILYHLQCCRFD